MADAREVYMRYLYTAMLVLAIFMLSATSSFAYTINHKDIGDIDGIPLFNGYGGIEFTPDENIVAKKWRDFVSPFLHTPLTDEYPTRLGPKAFAKVQEWKNRPHDLSLVRDVHMYWNQTITYAKDEETGETDDEWTLPAELEVRGKGDCEDYTIAKLFMLNELGFDLSKTVFVDLVGHAILAVSCENNLYILDNFKDDIIDHLSYYEWGGALIVNDNGTRAVKRFRKIKKD